MRNNLSKNFFSQFDDLSVFQFGSYNLSNLFYTLYLSKNTQKSGRKQKSRIGRFIYIVSTPYFLLLFLLRMIALRFRRSSRPRIVFIGNTGRHSIIDHQTYDLYNARIIAEVDSHEFVVLEEIRDGVDDIYPADFYYKEDLAVLVWLFRKLFQFINYKEIKAYIHNIQQASDDDLFSKLEIQRTVSHFFSTYSLVRRFLMSVKPDRVLLICHYSHAPFIAACKSLGIKVVELMHGSISDAHPHYNYPKGFLETVGDELFPDKLAVYGEFWKEIVQNGNLFSSDQIKVTGYFLKVPQVGIMKSRSGKKIILISSQWTVVDEIREYVKFLKANLDQDHWKIIIKPHPAEEPTTYQDLLNPGFVELSESDIYHALLTTDIHISVYSSVLYEAVRYDVVNYVLIVPRYASDYQILIDRNLAIPLLPDQAPEQIKKMNIPDQFFFADFDPSILID